mgnify:FL=1
MDKVVVLPEGLYEAPLNVKVLHLDKLDIGWLEEKDVAFEAIIQANEFNERQKNLAFKAYYYGPSGNEIYNEGMLVLITRKG